MKPYLYLNLPDGVYGYGTTVLQSINRILLACFLMAYQLGNSLAMLLSISIGKITCSFSQCIRDLGLPKAMNRNKNAGKGCRTM